MTNARSQRKKGDTNNSKSFMCGWNKTKVVGHASAICMYKLHNFFSSHLLSISLFTYSLPTTKHIHIPLNQTHPKVYLPCTEPDNQRWNERVLAPKQASWSNIQCSPRLGCTDSLGACRTLSYLYKINK